MSGWPLAAVLALRRKGDADARGALARALSLEADRSRELEASALAWSSATRLRDESARALLVSAGEGAPALRAAASFAERLRLEAIARAGALEGASAALGDASARVAGACDELANARAGMRALEGRREVWEAARRRELERREDREADDRVSARAAGR